MGVPHGLALADDECFCAKPTIATNEHGETWCSVCGERLLLDPVSASADDTPSDKEAATESE